MNTLIHNGRLIDPASGLDRIGDLAISHGRIVALGEVPAGFEVQNRVDATGLWVLPGLVDLCARLGAPGHGQSSLLESELGAAAVGGVTSLVCPPDTDPVLDETALVEMLKLRARKLSKCRLFPLGALTQGLAGQKLTEMAALTEAGCVGFSQAQVPITDTQVLMRSFQYAATFGYTLWLRPQDPWLGRGVAASGALATRMGLPGFPEAAETIALHTIFELMQATGARVHLCQISSAAGVALVRQAKSRGLPVTADTSVNHLHLTEIDIGYFDTRKRIHPPLRQQRDRDALQQGLLDGTLDALVSQHTPTQAEDKQQAFDGASPGATGLELLLPLALRWGELAGLTPAQALAPVTHRAAACLGQSTLAASLGRLVQGGVADLCLVDPAVRQTVTPERLVSQSRSTPFEGWELPGQVRATWVAGHAAYTASTLN
ncbi:dihydroorotase [Amphibiibacter pelophylacis]|uniref:Dihydroorotase n=1 Tax=Amphibiibacter pelophylacis TaxID=1799477 RepID=A0ACC6P472_9BURK